MVKKSISTTINITLYFEEDMNFARGNRKVAACEVVEALLKSGESCEVNEGN